MLTNTALPTQTQEVFSEIVSSRRSVKHFDPEATLPQAERDTLTRWAMQSPTSFNIQHWRFVWVTDKALQQQLQQAAWNQAQVGDASAVLVLCGDLNAYAAQPERYWRNAPQPVQQALVPMIEPFYHDKPQLQRDEVLRSCGMAAQTLMLGAKALGYDSCPMIGFDPEAVARLIQLPPNHLIAMMIPIGKATQPANPRGGDIEWHEAVIENHF